MKKNKKSPRKKATPKPVRGRAQKKPAPRFPKATVRKAKLAGSYDAAQVADLDEDHWYWADALNANAANSRDVRKTLRERAQYETDNNGYCGGLVDRLANDLVGTGPRPQLRIPGASREVVRAIELSFLAWSRRIRLPQKLRLLDKAATVRGEGFGLLTTNPALPASSVQLDLRLYECDQVETPWYDWGDPLAFDGGRLDEFGNVVEWHFLRAHPGSDVFGMAATLEYDTVPADRVVHWFKPTRAGQLRGVPEILSSLTLYAYLRRYTLATVTAAETAANIAGSIENDNVPQDSAEDPAANGIASMDRVPIPRGSLLTMPAGWKANAFRPEQPTTTYPMFKGELLTEAGAPVRAPRNIATNSSAEYNYSSARMDRGDYEYGIKVRRSDLREPATDKVIRAWEREARLVGIVPAELPPVDSWSWDWFFDAFPSVDPEKDAKLNDISLRNGSKNLAEICAEKGLDWEEFLEQTAAIQKRMSELGLPPLTSGPPPREEPSAPAAEEVPAA